AELKTANDLRAHLAVLAEQSGPFLLGDKIVAAREALEKYRQCLQATIDARRDPERGYKELHKVSALHDCFEDLDEAVKHSAESGIVLNPTSTSDKWSEKSRKARADLVRTASDLIGDINQGLHERIDASKKQNSISLAILVSTASLSMLL